MSRGDDLVDSRAALAVIGPASENVILDAEQSDALPQIVRHR